MSPTVLFVPGFWVGTTPFDQVSSLLQSQGFTTQTVALPSTGSVSPDNPTMPDDIAAIRTAVQKLVEAEQDVVLVLHSGGGFLGSNAIEGLGAKTRLDKGLKGGVTHIVFLAAAVFPEGFKHGPLPFAVVEVIHLKTFLRVNRARGTNDSSGRGDALPSARETAFRRPR